MVLPQVRSMIQVHLETYLNQRCTIEMQLDQPDPMMERPWVVVAADEPCRVQETTNYTRKQTVLVAGREGVIYDARIVLRVGTQVAEDFRITIDGGARWHVVNIWPVFADAVDQQVEVRRWKETE